MPDEKPNEYHVNAGMSPQDEMRWARVLREVHRDAKFQALRRVREKRGFWATLWHRIFRRKRA